MHSFTQILNRRAPDNRFLRKPVALLACALLQGMVVSAQDLRPIDNMAPVGPLTLTGSELLQEAIDPAARPFLPIFVFGDRLTGRSDLETVVEGDAMLRRGDLSIRADRLEYNQADDLAKASGKVRINRSGNVFEGPLLQLKVDAFEGFFEQPSYYFLSNDSHGEADRIDFIDENRSVVSNGSLTTCRRVPGPNWMPDWILRATSLEMDTAEDVGIARGASLSFKGVPILPIPYISFPLSDQRKSGVMPPTFGLDNVNGVEVAVPYYWNIAPNRDATLTPSLMSKRGLNLVSEFRYLENDYAGNFRLDLMPTDRLRDHSRWAFALSHQGSINNSLSQRLSPEGVALSLKLDRVGDDNYWRDFSRPLTSLTQRLLSNDATLAWSNGNFSSMVRTLKWQTLQDDASQITPPYDRLPQLATRYALTNVGGFNYSVDADYTRFQSERAFLGVSNDNGQRTLVSAQISRPWRGAAGFITPKLQLHATHYQFNAPLGNGLASANRLVPTLSIDSGLVFERDANYFGRGFRQTLEPRAFYVNTPYRDQNGLPNYDSGAYDFNFASIYSENAFVGNDRISDSNLLTLGLTSRLLSPQTGAELARFGVAQRFRLKDQLVTLPGGSPATDRLSDLLLGASLHWDPKWTLDSTVQYNRQTNQSVRSTFSASFSPSPYRTVTAAYRYQADSSRQLDLAWQWPVNDLWGDRGQNRGAGQGQGEGRWYSVGRLNYSLNESKLVSALVGFEYDAGCWLSRTVLERSQTSTTSATQRIMFQLEFVGFARLGVNPLSRLKDNIPNYQLLRGQTSAPSRFSNYD